MLIAWTEPAVISIPYPTVEALLCWWIVGMLTVFVLIARSAVVNPKVTAKNKNHSLMKGVFLIAAGSFIVVPAGIYYRTQP